MNTEALLVTRDGPVATVVLNNPTHLNALNLGMWQGLGDIMRTLSNDTHLRCVILRGAGDQAFAAGADIGEFNQVRANAKQAALYGHTMHQTLLSISQCQHPTVALIEGACIGGGLEIACACDLRICGSSSRFGVPINRLGLTMGYGELIGLLQVVGRANALEILLEGRIFDAQEAFHKRLVNRVVADTAVVDEALAIAARIAAGAPLVARWHKRFLTKLQPEPTLSQEEWEEGYACFDTEDYQTGTRAFVNKSKPQFNAR